MSHLSLSSSLPNTGYYGNWHLRRWPYEIRQLCQRRQQRPAILLSGRSFVGSFPSKKSFWGALEDSVRYPITFMAFSRRGVMVAPTTIASQYIAPAWRRAVIISFIWLLHRWKANVVTRSLALTIIGGVAIAFAARDILGNILSGLSIKISRPFSIGDTIKAGSVEGQVVEMGLATTSLLTAENFPVLVPNSLFSSQVIIKKLHTEWRAIVIEITFQIDHYNKIPMISEDIKTIIKSNTNVLLEKEAPYCFLSRIGRSFAELTIGYNLKFTDVVQSILARQDILLQSVGIIRQYGGRLF